jgi:hypothetical protein
MFFGQRGESLGRPTFRRRADILVQRVSFVLAHARFFFRCAFSMFPSINSLPRCSPSARERDERKDDPCTNHPDAARNTLSTLDSIVRELLTPIGVARFQKGERNAPMRKQVRRRHDAHVRANPVCTEHACGAPITLQDVIHAAERITDLATLNQRRTTD